MSDSPVVTALSRQLAAEPAPARWVVAFSGGLDSMVLLHATVHCLAQRRLHALPTQPLQALHVQHNLHPQAATWASHCRALAQQLEVPFHLRCVAVDRSGGRGVEAAAREVRYRAFSDFLLPGDQLLMAHHQDDQIETLLLRLLRGSGPAGVAGIPAQRPLGHASLARPLLALPRTQLRAYADAVQLTWIEDPSNLDPAFDRNYLRHTLRPAIAARWPNHARTLLRSAALAAESAQLLQQLAAIDFSNAPQHRLDRLHIPSLQQLDDARQRNLLRHWLGLNGLPLPDHNRLQRILDEVMPAAADRQPLVNWPGVEVRRYRDFLYAMPPLPPPASTMELEWDLSTAFLQLPDGSRLWQQWQDAGGVALRPGIPITLRFRHSGDPAQQADRHRLKRLLQQAGVPPWLRSHIPLIYQDDSLVVIPGVAIMPGWRSAAGAGGLHFRWQPAGSHVLPAFADSGGP